MVMLGRGGLDVSLDVANWLKSLKARLGPEKAGLELTTFLDHPDPVVRVLAAGIAWGRKADTRQLEEVLPIITEAMQTRDPLAFMSGCRVLATIGPDAGDVVPLVWGSLRDPDRNVRLNAAIALIKCCTDGSTLAKAAALLDDDDDGVAQYITGRLRRLSVSRTPN